MSDTNEFKPAKAWHASMSVALGLGLGFFVLVSVVGVVGVGLVVGYQNTVSLLAEKAELIISAQRNQTNAYFEAARNQVDFIAQKLTQGELDPTVSEEFTSLLTGALAATPQIIRIQYISAEEFVIGVERQQGETTPIFQRIGYDTALRRVLTESMKRLKPFWGSLLWRQEYEQPVLNYQRPVVRSGQAVGVISAWLSVNQLSEFLGDLELEFGANTFILHGRDQVLAHPLMAFGYPGLNQITPLPAQNKFTDPVVSAMWEESGSPSLARRFMAGPGVRFASFDQLDYVIIFREIEGFTQKPLIIATYFESHDMASEIERLKWAIIICFLTALVSSVVAAAIGRQIARPVRRLAEGSKRIYGFDLKSVTRIPRSFFRELDDAGQSFNTMLDGLLWFERYVPKGLVRKLMLISPHSEIESSHRGVVVMFTDIYGFTTLSEHMTAPATAAFLNDHFTMISECVEAEGGTVDKFIGDSVMAFWGAPERQEDMADRACRCALAISEALHDRNRMQADSVPGSMPIRLRIGIHMGRVVVGNIGSSDRVNYTLVGDVVNVAQRLEEAGKQLGNAEDEAVILVSNAVKNSLVKSLEFSRLGPQTLRGRQELVEVYALAPR